MYSNPAGYQQPIHQHSYTPGAQYHGPPPAKKPKGNPIITRYPPPPGYKGPAQPQAPYQAPAWSQPNQPYGAGQPNYPRYPQQPYSAPQPFQQPPWPAHQQPSYPPAGYAAQPSYYPGPSSSPAWQHPTPAPQSAPPQSWRTPMSMSQHAQRRHDSAPFSFSVTKPSGLVDGNGDPFPEQQPMTGTADDLEDDFEGECYFARRPDEINPSLSLGLIEWQAPLPTKRALPATFHEAELEALAPRQPRTADDEVISDYFTSAKRDEVFLSVRQMEEWNEVKDDLIFRELPRFTNDVVSMFELFQKYRDRPDPTWMAPPRTQAETPTPDQSRAPTPSRAGSNEPVMNGDRVATASTIPRSQTVDQSDILDNLEQALLPNNGTDGFDDRSFAGNGHHSRTTSISSQTSGHLSRPRPIVPVRDPAQEDILAALGVTGSPKKFYQTPGPVYGSAPREHTSRHNSITSIPGSNRVPPPPPSHDLRMQNEQHRNFNGYNGGRPGSAGSQHTASGSDFHADDNDATPRPRLDRIDSRKRAFDGSEDGSFDAEDIRDHDATPKQRRKQPRVDRGGAYGRRW